MSSYNSSMIKGSRFKASTSPAGSKNIWSEVGSLLFFALAVFVLCGLFTYHPEDPSLFSNARGAALNACGRVGAFVSALTLQSFGLGAFLLPGAFVVMAVSVFKREGAPRVVATLGGASVAVMALSVFLSIQMKMISYSGGMILTGGTLGAWISGGLVTQLNSTGASIASLLVFALSIALSTPISVAQMGGRFLRAIALVSWRLSLLLIRVTATYAAAFVSAALAKTAHFVGDASQKTFEWIAESLKNARENARLMRERRKFEKENQKDENLSASGDQGIVVVPESVDEPIEKEIAPVREVIAERAVIAEVEEKSAIHISDLRAPEILPIDESMSPALQLSQAQNPKTGHSDEKPKKARAPRPKAGAWNLPTIDFLRKVPKVEANIDREKLIQNSHILKQKFADFGIDGEVTAVRPGPIITLYEFKPGPGVKLSRIAGMADDLSMALSAQSVRILAPIPGKSVVGIEIPSEIREKVYLREFLQQPDFRSEKHAIPVAMGKDIGGQPYISDLARMPHLLCAGQTGSGKSVFMNGLICSLLYRFTPDELRMILVDPKFIEFRAYSDIPHLLLPVVDDPKHASTALKWAVREMERRYRILAIVGARNLASYNQKIDEMGSDAVRDLLFSESNQIEGAEKMSGGDWIQAYEPDEDGTPRVGKLPYIMVIIDELADLMMVAKKEVEVSIARIAQKARAAGIHMVVATQRPSTDVVTGLIKANLPSRASFQLASYIDSKTILDRSGAERLLGQGDMLFIPPGVSSLIRLHGAWVDDDEISKITQFLKAQGKPAYRDDILRDDEEETEEGGGSGDEEQDALFEEALYLIKNSRQASASYLQRHFRIGYNRAARLIETMEERGIVGPAEGARPREVLVR